MLKRFKTIELTTLEDLFKYSKEDQKQIIKHLINEYRKANQPREEITIECEVCYTEYPKRECYATECGHYFCKECYKEQWESFIIEPQTYFKCMEHDCECVVPYIDILNNHFYNDENELNIYIEALTNRNFALNISSCPKCDLQTFSDSNKKFIKCPNQNCGYFYCKMCKEDAHENKTCLEYQNYLVALDRAKKANIYNDIFKPCPNCNCTIEKNGGCQWMQCSRCGGYFCWVCLQVTNNHAHRQGQVCRPHPPFN